MMEAVKDFLDKAENERLELERGPCGLGGQGAKGGYTTCAKGSLPSGRNHN